jgi:hypothetical protein
MGCQHPDQGQLMPSAQILRVQRKGLGAVLRRVEIGRRHPGPLGVSEGSQRKENDGVGCRRVGRHEGDFHFLQRARNSWRAD